MQCEAERFLFVWFGAFVDGDPVSKGSPFVAKVTLPLLNYFISFVPSTWVSAPFGSPDAKTEVRQRKSPGKDGLRTRGVCVLLDAMESYTGNSAHGKLRCVYFTTVFSSLLM